MMTETTETTHYTTCMQTGEHWSLRLRRGLTLKLTDQSGQANVAMVMYNAHNFLERYNAPDTLKCQHTFHLTKGHCLYSDMGRILASIIHDTAGGHETVCGNSTAESIAAQFGARDYQNDRNQWHQNGHDAFLVELSKYGLTRADLPAGFNAFNRCVIGDQGDIALNTADVTAGRELHLRIEMDCLIVLHTCPHPLLNTESYPGTEVSLTLADAPAMQADDACLNHCDENRRGFENNRLYHLGVV